MNAVRGLRVGGRSISFALVPALVLAFVMGCAPGRRVAPRRSSAPATTDLTPGPAAADTTARPTARKPAPVPKKKATKPRKPASRSGPTAEQLRQAAQAYREGAEAMAQNRLGVAVRLFETVHESVPRYKDIVARLRQAYLFLGMEHYTEGKPEEAIQVWTKVLEIDPQNEKALAYIRKTKQELEKIRELPGAKVP